MSDIIKSDLQELFDQIRQRIIAARSAAARNINTLQVLTNFEIGRLIVEHEQQGATRAEYGKETLLALSHRLTKEFGRGFSRSNLEYMRKFFLTYLERLPEKSQTASGKLRHGSKEGNKLLHSCPPLAGGRGVEKSPLLNHAKKVRHCLTNCRKAH